VINTGSLYGFEKYRIYKYIPPNILYTEIQFELGESENLVNESTNLVRLTVIRSGQFSEIYNPSVEYRITTNGSSTGHCTMQIHDVDNSVH
jgi:hypothetical protein